METYSIINESIRTLVIILCAAGAIFIGGGFLAREKWRLLSDFWFHTSLILDQMLILTSRAKIGSTDDAFKKYVELRREHQDQAADCFNRLELFWDSEMVERTRNIFSLITTCDFNYNFKNEDRESREQFYGQNALIVQYRLDLLKATRGEFKRWLYWFLK